MSEVRHQLLITLVHGTWGHGFLARRQRQNRRPLWFEEGSSFLARLSDELDDVPHKITPLLWSGANSIFVRDKTAHVLAEHLSAEHAEHPQATQLIIAHSHGGNIAVRALHHLKQRDASPSCAESANPLVVTLATPFIEVHPADFGNRPAWVRIALWIAIIGLHLFSMVGLVYLLERWGLFDDKYFEVTFWAFVAVSALCFGFIVLWGFWWVSERAATARQHQVQALNDATQLGDLASTQRLLIIRAIDDEASLILALGTILNYLTTRLIVTTSLLFGLFLFATHKLGREFAHAAWPPVTTGWLALTILLLGMLVLSRSAHGHELAVSPMECQINTQSTPDAAGLSRIVTLVRRTFVRSLRHRIYDHWACTRAISDWVHSQLSALPVR